MKSAPLLTLIVLFAVTPAPSAQLATPAIADPESYAVYAALLRVSNHTAAEHSGSIAAQIETLPGPRPAELDATFLHELTRVAGRRFFCYPAGTMTVSAIPPKYRRGIGIMWIVMVVLGLIVAIGRNFAR